MSKKKTHEEYVEELKIKNPTIEVVGQYVNTRTPILHHCLIHDIYWETIPSRVLSGVGCELCRIDKFRQARCKTHNKYIEEVSIVNPDIDVIGEYVDAKTQIDFYCRKHNIFWKAYPDNILRGCGCHICLKEKIGNKNRKTHDKYVQDLEKVNPNIEVIEEYCDAETPIRHRCKVDGYVWFARPGNILFGKGCPRCNESHGEREIWQWLQNHNIEYVQQKTFNDCKNKKMLPFDFYLPKYNVCIEYDGEQHYRPVDFFGGDDGLKQRQHNDTIKTKYCDTHNIHLLRIPYFKNIEEELGAFFIHLI